MKKFFNPLRRIIPLFAVICLFAAAGCAPIPAADVTVWIDVPIDGLTLSGVQSINIDGHAASSGVISRVEIWVNGAILSAIDHPPMDGSLASFHQEWTPPEAGSYTIQAIAYNQEGIDSQPDSTRIEFVDMLEDVLPECSPAELQAPILVSPADGSVFPSAPALSWDYPESYCLPHSYKIDISEDPSFSDNHLGFGTLDENELSRTWPIPAGACYYWRALAYSPESYGPPSETRSFCIEPPAPEVTDTPTPTVTPTATITSTPALEPIVQFWADPDEIEAGGCTTLYWHAENVASLVFGGIEQPFDGSYKVCLCETERYSLTVSYLDGSQQKQILDVDVNGSCETPDDITPTPEVDDDIPPVPAPAVPQNGASLACRAAQSLVWMPVSDPSGIDHYDVQAQRHAGDHNWQAVSGSPFTVYDKTMQLPVECGYTYRWRVRAVDGADNTGKWSGWSEFVIPLS